VAGRRRVRRARRHDVALCVHDLLADHPFELTAPWTYVRFHGTSALTAPYHGRYGPHRLQRWVERLAEVHAAGGDAWCYFNNDWHGDAFRDATWLAAALAEIDGPLSGDDPSGIRRSSP
jgi:uncharacterized protein YecE (DUF72 family)